MEERWISIAWISVAAVIISISCSAAYYARHKTCSGSVKELAGSFGSSSYSCDDGASPHLQKLEDGKTYIVCTCKDAK